MRLAIQLVHRPRIARVISPQDWQRRARRILVLLSQMHAGYFRDESSPQGQKWAPLKASTREIAVQEAIRKVGGKAARPIVRRTKAGVLKVFARKPIEGKQKSATVRRTKRSRILQDTGLLRASVVAIHGGQKAIRRIKEFEIIWGTQVEYARRHQFGDPDRNLPARPFLGISSEGLREIMQILRGR